MKNFPLLVLIMLTNLVYSTQVDAVGLLERKITVLENSNLDDLLLKHEMSARDIKKRLKSSTAQILPSPTSEQFNRAASLLQPVTELSGDITLLDTNNQVLFTEVAVENGWRAISKQWLLMVTKAELLVLEALAQRKLIQIQQSSHFADLSLTLVQFKVEDFLDNRAELLALLPATMEKKLSRDYVYQTQQEQAVNSATTLSPDKPKQPSAICLDELKIGVVDTAVDNQHPVFTGQQLVRRRFIAEQLVAPQAHGTAVAALLVSNSPELPGLTPNAQLFMAEVFYSQNDFSQGANLYSLVAGLNWLLSEQVAVINMSLAGPDNAILAKVIEQLAAKGVLVVAAVGNEGPHSPPLYPAAYPEVIGVTAVDNKNNLYRWANRGDYVDFSALGVSVKTARAGGEFSYETGTSMAAPIVTAFAACAKKQALDYQNLLMQQVQDLGNTGRDPLFGEGRLGL